jgi:hypothetical protein
MADERQAELMQPGERRLHLGFDARRADYVTTPSPLGQIVQERRLADARLAADDEHLAPPAWAAARSGSSTSHSGERPRCTDQSPNAPGGRPLASANGGHGAPNTRRRT